jgi:hypothetical protein
MQAQKFRDRMKRVITIEKSSGRIRSNSGATVFDPKVGPPSSSPGTTLTLFEGTAEGEVQVTITFLEMLGGLVVLSADHPIFDVGSTEENERARVTWLAEFLRTCGAPVGSYPWGKVEAKYNPKTAEGLTTVSYKT